MLGINSKKELIKGEYAKAIREAAWRASTHNYNEEDERAIKWEKEVEKQGKVVWDLNNQ